MDIRNTQESQTNLDCYLSQTAACSGTISREHLVSRSVLVQLKKQGLAVSGLPWQPANTFKHVGLNTLTTKCLCETHNNALSSLDEAAAQLLRFTESAFSNRSEPSFHGLVSGHDVERWLLKTMVAFHLSKNLMMKGHPLNAPLHPTINVATLLATPQKWPSGSGLYFAGKVGDKLEQTNRFGLVPLTVQTTGELVGMNVEILGIIVTFLATSPKHFTNTPITGLYRPGRIAVQIHDLQNDIQLCWEDENDHGDFILTFTPSPVAPVITASSS